MLNLQISTTTNSEYIANIPDPKRVSIGVDMITLQASKLCLGGNYGFIEKDSFEFKRSRSDDISSFAKRRTRTRILSRLYSKPSRLLRCGAL
jgi:hypothetical protein